MRRNLKAAEGSWGGGERAVVARQPDDTLELKRSREVPVSTCAPFTVTHKGFCRSTQLSRVAVLSPSYHHLCYLVYTPSTALCCYLESSYICWITSAW